MVFKKISIFLLLCMYFTFSVKAEKSKNNIEDYKAAIIAIVEEIQSENTNDTLIESTLDTLKKYKSKKYLLKQINELVEFSKQHLDNVDIEKIAIDNRKPIAVIHFFNATLFRGNGYRFYALENHEKAINLVNKYNIPETEKLLSAAYVQAGIIYYAHKDFEKSFSYFDQAEKIAEAIKNPPKIYNANIEKIRALKRRGHEEDIIEIESIYAKMNQFIQGNFKNDKGKKIDLNKTALTKILRNKGKYDLALNEYLKAADYYQKEEEWNNLFGVYYDIADGVYYEQKMYDKANIYLQKAMEIAEAKELNLKKHSRNFDVEKLKGDLALKTQKYEKALNHYQTLLQLVMLDFVPKELSENPKQKQLLADPYVFRALRKKGLTYLTIFKENADTLLLKNALNAYETAFQVTEKIRRELSFEASNLYMSEFSFAVFEEAIETCLLLAKHTNTPEQYYKKALEISEKGRLNTFRKMLNSKSASQSLPDSLKEEEKVLKSSLRKCNALAKQDVLYKDSVFYYQEKIENLVDFLEENHSQYHKIKYRPNSLDIDKIQHKEFQSDQAIIEYFYGEENIYIFCVSHNIISVESIPNSKELQQDLSTFLQYLQDPKALKPPNGYRLYKTILGNIVNTLPSSIKLLKIIPDGKLNSLPYEALPVNEAASTLFIEKNEHIISYGASIEILYDRTEKNATKSEQLMAFMPSYENEKAFQNNQALVETINQNFDCTIYAKEAATSSNFLQANKNTQIIHFFGHGKADENQPSNARLLFSDKSVYVHEIYDLDIDADLVVLAACETAKGKQQKAEGVLSLARAFQYANARSLIVNLWNGYADILPEILQLFYTQMASGIATDQALHNAKLSYLKNAPPQFKHPHYWAGFIYTGEAFITKGGKYSLWNYLVFSILGLIIFIFIGKKYIDFK